MHDQKACLFCRHRRIALQCEHLADDLRAREKVVERKLLPAERDEVMEIVLDQVVAAETRRE